MQKQNITRKKINIKHVWILAMSANRNYTFLILKETLKSSAIHSPHCCTTKKLRKKLWNWSKSNFAIRYWMACISMDFKIFWKISPKIFCEYFLFILFILLSDELKTLIFFQWNTIIITQNCKFNYIYCL